jgi:hypothetical protein
MCKERLSPPRKNEATAAICGRFCPHDLKSDTSIRKRIRECWNFCNKKGWMVRYVFVDVCKVGDRNCKPDLQRLIEDNFAEELDFIVFRESKYECIFKKNVSSSGKTSYPSANESTID